MTTDEPKHRHPDETAEACPCETCPCTDRTCVHHGHPPIIVFSDKETGEVLSGIAPWATTWTAAQEAERAWVASRLRGGAA